MTKTNVRRHDPGHGPNKAGDRHLMIVQGLSADEIKDWAIDQSMATLCSDQPAPSSVKEWWLLLNEPDAVIVQDQIRLMYMRFGGEDTIWYVR